MASPAAAAAMPPADPASVLAPDSASTSPHLLLNVISVTVTISTFMQFLASSRQCWIFRQRRSTGDASALPYIVGALNCTLWTHYGVLIDQHNVSLINGLGFVVMASCVAVFLQHAPRKSRIVKQTLIASLFFAMLEIWVLFMTEDVLERKATLGFVGAALSVGFTAAPLASVAVVIRTGNTESLPFGMILMTFVVCAQWWFFGVLLGDVYMTWPNAMGCLLAAVQLALFAYFPAKTDVGVA